MPRNRCQELRVRSGAERCGACMKEEGVLKSAGCACLCISEEVTSKSESVWPGQGVSC